MASWQRRCEPMREGRAPQPFMQEGVITILAILEILFRPDGIGTQAGSSGAREGKS
ncbi:uncharacterized protein Bfra_009997 [Botrytis fragariae]|uniref:Uncharacterized protein n=1 Tax=Botrytis fragariae TaxID=1964551 RepID=A0A8H6AMQ8_9HELO|nr:uncharacterized protein Bfra_009997 [Botrytis fragariae]KAF5870608.1 hypothetical protein Bfra_009997 [Botrytis fragariae]